MTTAAAMAKRMTSGIQRRSFRAIVVMTLARIAAKSSSLSGCFERNSVIFIACLFLPVRINGDVALLKGIMKEMLERDGSGKKVLAHDFIEQKPKGSTFSPGPES